MGAFGVEKALSKPKVSFVVPCYKLGHLLAECIESILVQSYEDFEILVMNDRSPDNTTEVANSFQDLRVEHILNENNLGHLRNYNKGIAMSQGEYIWLISADDYLRDRSVLAKYVGVMEANPRVGYSFCPGMSVRNGCEGRLIGNYAEQDCIVDGHQFLRTLLDNNMVLAASVLVRRDCYEKISVFPLEAQWRGNPVDMGWLGDWYLWCVFALEYHVAYFAEAMVCYREHDLSMTTNITRKETIQACAEADIAMLWLVRGKANDAGLPRVAADCLEALGNEYRRQGSSKRYRASTHTMSRNECEVSLLRNTDSEHEKKIIRAQFFLGTGDRLRRLGKHLSAARCYRIALKHDPWLIKVYAKLIVTLLAHRRTFLPGSRNSQRETVPAMVPRVE